MALASNEKCAEKEGIIKKIMKTKNNLTSKLSDLKRSLNIEDNFIRPKPLRLKVPVMELDSTFIQFLGSFEKRTRSTYLRNIKLWYAFIEMNGQELLENA